MTAAQESRPDCVHYLQVPLSFRSRQLLRLMRLVAPRLLHRMAHSSQDTILALQKRAANQRWPRIPGMPISEAHIGGIKCHCFGDLDPNKPLVLWLHGGAFLLPAAPMVHFTTAAKICEALGASGVMPDYRLAPQHPFPAALDDCEQTYLALLERGFSADKIALIGDSAGGNLMFGVMQRARAAGLPLPGCGVSISPAAELARATNPPSLYLKRCKDPLLPLAAMPQLAEVYSKHHDASNPELSPLYMDCSGMPPLLFLTSTHEILMDDIVSLAERCHGAGVETQCDVWPELPHAFPLFERLFPEARIVLSDIADFARRHLAH